MSDREQPDTPEQYRVTGEDTPTWLPMGFTLIGVLLAATTAWLWMNEQPRLQEQRSQGNLIQEQSSVSATQPAANLPTKPAAVPVETPEGVAVAKGNQSIQSEPFPPPSVPADVPARPSDLQDSPRTSRRHRLPRHCPLSSWIVHQPSRSRSGKAAHIQSLRVIFSYILKGYGNG